MYNDSVEVSIAFQASLAVNTVSYSFWNNSRVTTLFNTSLTSSVDGQISAKNTSLPSGVTAIASFCK